VSETGFQALKTVRKSIQNTNKTGNYFTKAKESPKVNFQDCNRCTTQFSGLKQV